MIAELTDTWWRVDEVLLGLADWRSVTPASETGEFD